MISQNCKVKQNILNRIMTDYRNIFIRKGCYKTSGLRFYMIPLCLFFLGACVACSIMIFGYGDFRFKSILSLIAIFIMTGSFLMLTYDRMHSWLTIDSYGIKIKKGHLIGKNEEYTYLWKDIDENFFSIADPLENVGSFFKYFKYVFNNKQSQNYKGMPEVLIKRMDDVSNAVLTNSFAFGGTNLFLWNIRKENSGDEDSYTFDAAFYDDDDKLLGVAENLSFKDNMLCRADGSRFDCFGISVPDDMADIIDGYEKYEVYYDIESREIYFTDEIEIIKSKGKTYAVIGDCNLVDFRGSGAIICSAINYFSGKEYIDIEKYCSLRHRVNVYYMYYVLSIVTPVLLFMFFIVTLALK